MEHGSPFPSYISFLWPDAHGIACCIFIVIFFLELAQWVSILFQQEGSDQKQAQEAKTFMLVSTPLID